MAVQEYSCRKNVFAGHCCERSSKAESQFTNLYSILVVHSPGDLYNNCLSVSLTQAQTMQSFLQTCSCAETEFICLKWGRKKHLTETAMAVSLAHLKIDISFLFSLFMDVAKLFYWLPTYQWHLNSSIILLNNKRRQSRKPFHWRTCFK